MSSNAEPMPVLGWTFTLFGQDSNFVNKKKNLLFSADNMEKKVKGLYLLEFLGKLN